jgi:hypothetical protein
MNGPLTNINEAGFAAASFHSWPDTLAWDAYSGDYGPNFVGLALGSATYVVPDPDLGVVAYGGLLVSRSNDSVTVQPRDAARRRVFVAQLKLLVTVDAGVIHEVTFRQTNKTLSITMGQQTNGLQATAAILRIQNPSAAYTVTSSGFVTSRLGWRIPLNQSSVTVDIGPVSS